MMGREGQWSRPPATPGRYVLPVQERDGWGWRKGSLFASKQYGRQEDGRWSSILFNYETLFLSCVHCSFLSARVVLALFTRPLMLFFTLNSQTIKVSISTVMHPSDFSRLWSFRKPRRLRRNFVLYGTRRACCLCRSCFGSHFSSLFSGVGSWRCHTPVFVKIQDLSTRATPARFSTGTDPGGSTGSVVFGGWDTHACIWSLLDMEQCTWWCRPRSTVMWSWFIWGVRKGRWFETSLK